MWGEKTGIQAVFFWPCGSFLAEEGFSVGSCELSRGHKKRLSSVRQIGLIPGENSKCITAGVLCNNIDS